MTHPVINLEVPIFGLDLIPPPTSSTLPTPPDPLLPTAQPQDFWSLISTVELNASGSYRAGGLTPTPAEVNALHAHLTCLFPPPQRRARPGIKVMIRPRGAPRGGGQDFLYSPSEVDQMESSMRQIMLACPFLGRGGAGTPARSPGDGFIFGALSLGVDGAGGRTLLRVDKEACARLVRAAARGRGDGAGGAPCYFHRAFDEVVAAAGGGGWEGALRDLAECGFSGLLTSGGKGGAVDNKEALWDIARFVGGSGRSGQVVDGMQPGEERKSPKNVQELELVVGGGVRSRSVGQLLDGWPTEDAPRVMLHSACLRGDGTFDAAEVGGILKASAGRLRA